MAGRCWTAYCGANESRGHATAGRSPSSDPCRGAGSAGLRWSSASGRSRRLTPADFVQMSMPSWTRPCDTGRGSRHEHRHPPGATAPGGAARPMSRSSPRSHWQSSRLDPSSPTTAPSEPLARRGCKRSSRSSSPYRSTHRRHGHSGGSPPRCDVPNASRRPEPSTPSSPPRRSPTGWRSTRATHATTPRSRTWASSISRTPTPPDHRSARGEPQVMSALHAERGF